MTLSNELKVGATILLTAVIFFIGLRYLQNVPVFQSSTPLHTYLEDSAGLVPGNIVQISGVKVGDVKNVRLADDGQRVRVDFTVFDRVQLREGSQMRISGIAALGGVRLSIDPGPPDAPPLAAGSAVPAVAGQDLLATVNQQAPGLLMRTDTLLAEATQSISQAGHLFASSQEEIHATLAALRSSTEAINRALYVEEGRVNRVLANTEAFTAGMRDFAGPQSDSLAIAVAQLNHTLRRLDTSMDRLDTSTARVDHLLESVEAGEGTAGKFVRDPALYDQLEETVNSLNEVLEDLQRNPSRYLRDMSIIKLF